MKNFFFIAISFFLLGCSQEEEIQLISPIEQELKTVSEKINDAEWDTNKISEEIVWKYFHFDDLFSSNQSVTILEVDLNDQDVSIEIPYVETGFIRTSDAAWTVGASAANNGSFFDTSKGGSTVFLKRKGTVITTTRNGFTPYREHAGFALNPSGDGSIVKKPTTGWESLDEFPDVLASGPLLLSGGNFVSQVNQAFNSNRHPRTAIGYWK